LQTKGSLHARRWLISELPDGWSVDVDGEKDVVNFPVDGDYGHAC